MKKWKKKRQKRLVGEIGERDRGKDGKKRGGGFSLKEKEGTAMAGKDCKMQYLRASGLHPLQPNMLGKCARRAEEGL
jgi:hypothetical protein